MKRKLVPKSKVADPESSLEEKECSDEEVYKVDEIVAVKKSRLKNSGGYVLLIKWDGYEESQNTWEPMESMLSGWNCERKDIYSFFAENNIDVDKCSDFDFIEGKMKREGTKSDKPKSSSKTNSKANHSKNQIQKHYRNGYICDVSHEVKDGNLQPETNADYAKEPNFLYKMKCHICYINFVATNDSGGDNQYKISLDNPCYICSASTACTYYVCGTCYNKKIILGGKPKRNRSPTY